MSTAADAFQATLNALGIDEDDVDAERFGRRAALLAASDLLWEREIGRLLSAAEVGEMLDITKQAVSLRVKTLSLLALPTAKGGYGFPHWQFGQDGQPLAGLMEVLRAFRSEDVLRAADQEDLRRARSGLTVETPWTIAAWMVSHQDELADRTPVELLHDGEGEQVRLAALRYADRLQR